MISLLLRHLALVGLVYSGLAQAVGIGVHDPWVAEAPPIARVMAGYLILENLSDQDQVLTGISSPSFERVEIHRTEMHKGMARMVPMQRVTIARQAKAVFEPGGQHLMLIGPHRPLREGDAVGLTLEFASGERMAVTAPVRKAQARAHPHH